MFDAVQNIWLFSAGALAAFLALVHVFLGGPEVAKPLLQSNDMPDVAKYVNYYCWHLVTITIFAMAIGLIWDSVDPVQTGLAWMWAVIAVLFTLWSIVLVVWKGQKPFQMPQWLLFAPVAALAIVGLAR